MKVTVPIANPVRQEPHLSGAAAFSMENRKCPCRQISSEVRTGRWESKT